MVCDLSFRPGEPLSSMSWMKPIPTGGAPTPLDLLTLPPTLARLPTTRTHVAEPLNCQPLSLRKKCPRGFSPLRPLCALMRTLATGTTNLAEPATRSCFGPFPGLCLAVAIAGIAASTRAESAMTAGRVMPTTSYRLGPNRLRFPVPQSWKRRTAQGPTSSLRYVLLALYLRFRGRVPLEGSPGVVPVCSRAPYRGRELALLHDWRIPARVSAPATGRHHRLYGRLRAAPFARGRSRHRC